MRPSGQLLKLLLAWATLGLVVAVAHIGVWESSALFSLLFWTYFVVLAAAALIDGLASRRAPELEVSRTLAPHLALGIRAAEGPSPKSLGRAPEGDLTLDGAIECQIRGVLEKTGGNKTEAASLLGISRSRLTRYVERFGL